LVPDGIDHFKASIYTSKINDKDFLIKKLYGIYPSVSKKMARTSKEVYLGASIF